MEMRGCALMCVSSLLNNSGVGACLLAEGQAAVQLLCLSLVKQVALNSQCVRSQV